MKKSLINKMKKAAVIGLAGATILTSGCAELLNAAWEESQLPKLGVTKRTAINAASAYAGYAIETNENLTYEEKQRVHTLKNFTDSQLNDFQDKKLAERQYYQRPQESDFQRAVRLMRAREALELQKQEAAQIGKIEKMWIDHNVYLGEEKGMNIHTKFRIKNRKNSPVGVVTYFYNVNGEKLMDKDGWYNSVDGQVCTLVKKLRPGYEDTTYEDATMFIPNSQLDITKPGKHELKFQVWLWDYNAQPAKNLSKSEWGYINLIK